MPRLSIILFVFSVLILCLSSFGLGFNIGKQFKKKDIAVAAALMFYGKSSPDLFKILNGG